MAAEFFKVVDDGVEDPGLTAVQEIAFHESPRLEVRMFNVGDGEIILLTMPDRRNAWLVDGGSGAKVHAPADAIVAYLRDRQLVLRGVVLSHPHQDHGRAIGKVLRAGPLAETVTFYRSNDPLFWQGRQWLRNLRTGLDTLGSRVQEPAPITKNSPLVGVNFGSCVVANMFAGDPRKNGLTSIFLLVRFDAAQVLLTGDVKDCNYELELLKEFGNAAFDADVLKLTHHGNSNGTSKKLLCAVKPGIAIASTADDTGHSLEFDVLDRLREGEASREIYETLVNGDIILQTDGLPYHGGVLYHVEFQAPGRFADVLGAGILSVGEVDGLREDTTGPLKHKKCKEEFE